MNRYELSVYVGPCTQHEAEALAEAILDLPEARDVYGGAVEIKTVAADDPVFAEIDGEAA